MTTTQWRTERSDGSETLASSLQIAIWDYVRAFGRSPRLIVVPFWRVEDVKWEYIDSDRPWVRSFRGIPVKVTILREYIELRNE